MPRVCAEGSDWGAQRAPLAGPPDLPGSGRCRTHALAAPSSARKAGGTVGCGPAEAACCCGGVCATSCGGCTAGALAAALPPPGASRSAASSGVCRDSSLPQLPGGSVAGGWQAAQAGGAGVSPLPATDAGGALLGTGPSCVQALSTDPALNRASWLMQGLRIEAGWEAFGARVS